MVAQPLVGPIYKSADDLGPTRLPLPSSPLHHMSQLRPALPVSRHATLLHTSVLADVLNPPLRTLPPPSSSCLLLNLHASAWHHLLLKAFPDCSPSLEWIRCPPWGFDRTLCHLHLILLDSLLTPTWTPDLNWLLWTRVRSGEVIFFHGTLYFSLKPWSPVYLCEHLINAWVSTLDWLAGFFLTFWVCWEAD